MREPETIWRIKDPIRLQGERRRAEITVRILKPQRSELILDVGCGEGYQTSHFVGHGASIIGVDISQDRLKEAKEKVACVDFVCASSERLPFKNQVFDKVTCLELLEHLWVPSQTIREIKIVLKERGTCIISVPYRQIILTTRCIHCGRQTPLWGHLHMFDEHRLVSLLPNIFTLIRSIRICSPPSCLPVFDFLPTGLWRLLDRLAGSLPYTKPSWFISEIKKESK